VSWWPDWSLAEWAQIIVALGFALWLASFLLLAEKALKNYVNNKGSTEPKFTGQNFVTADEFERVKAAKDLAYADLQHASSEAAELLRTWYKAFGNGIQSEINPHSVEAKTKAILIRLKSHGC
jgi:hypothetical protein